MRTEVSEIRADRIGNLHHLVAQLVLSIGEIDSSQRAGDRDGRHHLATWAEDRRREACSAERKLLVLDRIAAFVDRQQVSVELIVVGDRAGGEPTQIWDQVAALGTAQSEQKALPHACRVERITLPDEREGLGCEPALEVTEVEQSLASPHSHVCTKTETCRQVLRALARFTMHRMLIDCYTAESDQRGTEPVQRTHRVPFYVLQALQRGEQPGGRGLAETCMFHHVRHSQLATVDERTQDGGGLLHALVRALLRHCVLPSPIVLHLACTICKSHAYEHDQSTELGYLMRLPEITDIRTYVLKLAVDTPYLGAMPDSSATGYQVREPWRSLYSPRYETLLVEVVADDGNSGWGEALAPVAPEVPAAIVDLLLAPVLRGRSATSPRPNWSRLRDLMRERGHLVGHQADALAAVDIALWDLAGKVTGRSVVELLGGAFRSSIPTYVSGLPKQTNTERAALAKDWVARGAQRVKLHIGNGVEADLATVDAIRDAAPDLSIAVDAHWAYSITDALRLAEGLAQRDCWFLEAPLAPEDRAGHVELVARSLIPIAVGETMRNRYEFGDWLGQRALRLAQPDIARTGITEGMAIADLAAAAHVPVAPHHSVGLGIAMAAGLHVSAAIEDLPAFEYQPTSTEVGQRILHDPLLVAPDHIDLPAGPGLGIDVDIDAVTALASHS